MNCARCGAEIAAERLEYLPGTRTCAACSKDRAKVTICDPADGELVVLADGEAARRAKNYTRRGRDWHKLSTNVRGPKLLMVSDLGIASRGSVMQPITFTADDRNTLAHDRYHHPDARVRRKMEVLWLKSHGLNHDQIAAYADVSRRTVQRYLDQYLEGGLPRLRRCQWHRPQSALAEHESSLEEFFLRHPVRSAKQARAIIEQQTGVRRGLSQVRHFLKGRLRLRWRKTGAIPVPPKKTIEEHAREQAAFVQDKLEPRLEQARRGQRQVYFVDAAHFVFAPFLGCVWCAARLFVRAASGRKRYNVLGALDAVTHRLVRVTNHGYINAESVCACCGRWRRPVWGCRSRWCWTTRTTRNAPRASAH